MRMKRKHLCSASLLFVLVGCLASAQKPEPGDFKFEVLSVARLSDKEAAARTTDAIGYDVVVRVRLSTQSHGLRFYTWPNRIEPCRFAVQMVGNQVVWLENPGLDGTGRLASSPGLRQVCAGTAGTWIDLPAHSAVEWEELDSTTYFGERHAFAIFVQTKDKQDSQEVISDAFTVPSTKGDDTGKTSVGSILHESGHADPPKQQ
jgi:hypothetical protein